MCFILYYSKYFPENCKKYKNKNFLFLIGLCSYVFYNNMVYVDESVMYIPDSVKIVMLSNNFYSFKNNKKFILPLLNKNTEKQDDMEIKSDICILPLSHQNPLDNIFFNGTIIPNIINVYEYITPNTNYDFYANNLYVSTKLSYLTALCALLMNCNYMFFKKYNHSYNYDELIEFCDFFNISYDILEEDIIKVDIINSKEHIIEEYAKIQYKQHLLDVINNVDDISSVQTLTDFLKKVFKK